MISLFTKSVLIQLSFILCISSVYAQKDTVKPIEPSDKPLTGTVYFYNGNSISGQLSAWGKDKITINSPDLVEPVSFSTSQILNITLKDTHNSSNKVGSHQNETTLVINNRDNQKGLHGIIKGNFTDIDDKHVTLKTSYAGTIKVLKKFITRMEIDSKKGYFYLGPKSLDEWYNNSIIQNWEYNNHALISGSASGNIAQDLAIPEEASISFDLSWKDDEYLTLYLFSSDHKQKQPDDFYLFKIEKGRYSLRKYSGGRQKPDMSSEKQDNQRNQRNRFRRIQPQGLNSKTKKLHAHYDIYMSKLKGEFHIYRNGVKVDTFTDSAPKPENFGTALHIVSSNKTPIRIKNLSLSKWGGHIPSAIDAETFAKVKGEGERILLKNGDILLGKIGKVRNSLMQVETLYTPLNIPIIRMRSIDLTGSKLKEEPIMYSGDIKCWFKDNGWIILKPISIEGNILTAYHQALGENKYNINIFERIDLNIYNKNFEGFRKSDTW